MTPHFFQARTQFLKANRKRFTEWGESNNHRLMGAGLDEFHSLFVLMSAYYGRLRWISKRKPIWDRRKQLSAAACDRWFGHTPYGKMFSKFAWQVKGARR